ncbi:MAG: hypothetical protein U0361_10395 [Nitrospiraceae bacterium]
MAWAILNRRCGAQHPGGGLRYVLAAAAARSDQGESELRRRSCRWSDWKDLAGPIGLTAGGTVTSTKAGTLADLRLSAVAQSSELGQLFGAEQPERLRLKMEDPLGSKLRSQDARSAAVQGTIELKAVELGCTPSLPRLVTSLLLCRSTRDSQGCDPAVAPRGTLRNEIGSPVR